MTNLTHLHGILDYGNRSLFIDDKMHEYCLRNVSTSGMQRLPSVVMLHACCMKRTCKSNTHSQSYKHNYDIKTLDYVMLNEIVSYKSPKSAKSRTSAKMYKTKK